MLEYLGAYVARVWGSTLPTRLAWAIATAVVFELLIWLLSRRFRRALAPALQRELTMEATERVKHRRVVLGLPLLLLRGALYLIGVLVILRYLGFSTGTELVPLLIALLGAVVLTLWGSLRDAAAGYFLQLDGLYAVGDRVTIGGHHGVVTEVGLRQTRLKGADGREIVIANGEVREVQNHSRGAVR